jgi:hypothetical protein
MYRAIVPALLVAALFAGPAAVGNGWELIDESDGVRVWRRTLPDSSVLAFRGAATVDAPIARVIGVLLDSEHSTEWVDLLIESRRLRESDDGAVILYNRYDLSWPLQDRDYVLRRVLELDPDAGRVTATYTSVEDPAWPEQGCCVRALSAPTSWRFRREGPDRTAVEVEVATDPRGSIPAWLVNLVQRDWPRKSIRNLAARAGRPDVTPYPPLADW